MASPAKVAAWRARPQRHDHDSQEPQFRGAVLGVVAVDGYHAEAAAGAHATRAAAAQGRAQGHAEPHRGHALGVRVRGDRAGMHALHPPGWGRDQELITPEPATDFVVGYVVLALSFMLEGGDLVSAVGPSSPPTAELFGRDVIEEVMATSDPTLRAVFFEDAAALVGLVIATGGLAAHEVTGSSTPDALGSILVGVLLAVVAVVLIDRNRQFLVGEEADPAFAPPPSRRCSICPRSPG